MASRFVVTVIILAREFAKTIWAQSTLAENSGSPFATILITFRRADVDRVSIHRLGEEMQK